MTLGERLRQVREGKTFTLVSEYHHPNGRVYEVTKNRTLSQFLLSKEIGISSRNAVKDWEEGKYFPTLDSITKICDIYQITYEQFFKGVDYAKSLYTVKQRRAKKRAGVGNERTA